MFRYFAPKVIKLLVLILLVLSFLVLGNLYTYKRLTAEKPIVQLEFNPVSNQVYDATIRIGENCEESNYRMYGDEWQIDTEFLKWKTWATLLGLKSMYRLDRLSGRYKNIRDENIKNHSAHELKTRSTLNLNKIAEKYNNSFPPVDTIYGSSAYSIMKPNTLFTVYVTQSGILVREQEKLTDTKQLHECISGKSKWKDTIVNLDQRLLSMIKTFY